MKTTVAPLFLLLDACLHQPTARPLATPDALRTLVPRSSVIVVTLAETGGSHSIPDYVKEHTHALAFGKIAPHGFPLPQTATDRVEIVSGLSLQVLVSWLDPLTPDSHPAAPHFGANTDFLAYVGDGFGMTPYYAGSDEHGFLWANHEYVSGTVPHPGVPPTGQHLLLARFMVDQGLLSPNALARWNQADVDIFTAFHKRQLGGSWMRIEKHAGAWQLVRTKANRRFDATDRSLFQMTGPYARHTRDHTDDGRLLPPGVVVGTLANCSGGVTPWGTIITSEENTQDYYGDVEAVWGSEHQFTPGLGFDPGDPIRLAILPDPRADFVLHSHPAQGHQRDLYGWQTEVDPSLDPSDFLGKRAKDRGHTKLSALGRARWESITFVVSTDWLPPEGRPLVAYYGDDRINGRVYKFVSRFPYRHNATLAEKRALLHEGRVFVAHLAGLDNANGYTLRTTGNPPRHEDGARGTWVELSLDNLRQMAPNAFAIRGAAVSVADALRDMHWNGLGAFTDQTTILAALHTAGNKIGVFENNRPEDTTFNPFDQTLYVAFTKHKGRPSLDESGRLARHMARRTDSEGRIFAIFESGSPDAATTFTFWQVWGGRRDKGHFSASNPDNLMLDATGGLWFGTDGDFDPERRTADALYYLDLNPAHAPNGRDGRPGTGDEPTLATYGLPIRILTMPSDAEATGPAFSAGMTSLFLSVQHPGEEVPSRWPAAEH